MRFYIYIYIKHTHTYTHTHIYIYFAHKHMHSRVIWIYMNPEKGCLWEIRVMNKADINLICDIFNFVSQSVYSLLEF